MKGEIKESAQSWDVAHFRYATVDVHCSLAIVVKPCEILQLWRMSYLIENPVTLGDNVAYFRYAFVGLQRSLDIARFHFQSALSSA